MPELYKIESYKRRISILPNFEVLLSSLNMICLDLILFMNHLSAAVKIEKFCTIPFLNVYYIQKNEIRLKKSDSCLLTLERSENIFKIVFEIPSSLDSRT